MLKCSACQILKPPEDFHRNSQTSHRGYRDWYCRPCHSKKGKQARGGGRPEPKIGPSGERLCFACDAPARPKTNYCCSCAYRRRLERHGKAEVYRQQRDRYLRRRSEQLAKESLARSVNPGRRGYGKKAARWNDLAARSDGTVTPEAVRELFGKSSRCCYCAATMKSAEKTMDHVVPVAMGGGHSLSNVAVCCRACNSSKQHFGVDEWAARLMALGRADVAERALRLFRRVTGTDPRQVVMPLYFGAPR